MIERAIVFAAAVLLGGCASYTPHNLSGMLSEDLCYFEYLQGRNLSAEGRQAIQSELQRRNDNCRNHTTAVAQRFDAFMWHETYGKQSP